MNISADTKLIAIGTFLILFLFGGGSIFLTYQAKQKNTPPPTPMPIPTLITLAPEPTAVTIANPASVNCTKLGGTLTLKKRGDGGEYGVCDMGGGRLCEEWALFRGSCPKSGIKVTGFDTDAQVYCAITGGKTLATKNATCTLFDGTVCSNDDYFNGKCDVKNTNGKM